MQFYQKIFSIIAAVLLVLIIYFSTVLIHKGEDIKEVKSEYAVLHSVTYGIFNSELWREKIVEIFDKKIDTFELNATNRDAIKGYIETIIDTLVVEAERIVKERNSGNRGFLDSLLGSTKQMITESLIDFKDLRRRVPEFTDTVMQEVEKPENQQRAKRFIRQKLKAFMVENFQQTTHMRSYEAILEKYGLAEADCHRMLDTKIKEERQEMHRLMKTILLLAGLVVVFVLLCGILTSVTLWILAGTTVSLLISGLMLPMLDIEAKIDQLLFTILDQQVLFENQILFFQSKSIYDLVRLLFESDEMRMVFVGILLVIFSVIFPLLKLIATSLYFYVQSAVGNNPFTRFFALYSTKWSMADVFVVSIFMAYLGLDGVVSSELEALESKSHPITIISTNGTHLEVGFFLFLGFVLTSFVLSFMVQYRHQKRVQS